MSVNMTKQFRANSGEKMKRRGKNRQSIFNSFHVLDDRCG